MQQGFDINKLREEAKTRWLKPSEVHFILQNHERYNLTSQPPKKPPGGSLFLFNRRVLRYFRNDGHAWRKKRDGRAVGEGHERLKVGNVDALNCYYAHGQENPYFQRRSYWMLDPAYGHIVLVHYREVAEGRYTTGSVLSFSTDESSNFKNTTSSSSQIQSFTPDPNSIYEPCHSSCSPGSVEDVSSVERLGGNQLETVDVPVNYNPSSQPEVRQALRKLTEQLSLDDDDNSINFEEVLRPFSNQSEEAQDLALLDFVARETHVPSENLLEGYDYREPPDHAEDAGKHGCYSGINLPKVLGGNGWLQSRLPSSDFIIYRKDDPSWKDMLDLSSSPTKTYDNSLTSNLQVKEGFTNFSNFGSHASRETIPVTLQESDVPSEQVKVPGTPYEVTEKSTFIQLDHQSHRPDNKLKKDRIAVNDLQLQLSAARRFLLGSDSPLQSPLAISQSQIPENGKPMQYNAEISVLETHSAMMLGTENSIDWTGVTPLSGENSTASPDVSGMWFDQHQFGSPLATTSSLTVAQKQWFSICEMSPEWAFSSETTKVIITGTFLCNPSECPWAVMFGDVEVPAEIVQEGVLRCKSPQHLSGKVTLCITSGNRESCSEIREFEFCAKSTASNSSGTSLQADASKNGHELSLLIRFYRMLLCGGDTSSMHRPNGDVDAEAMGRSKLLPDPGCQFTEEFFAGAENQLLTMDWIIQELLKDKFQQWLLLRCQGNQGSGCVLSKHEQCIIHLISGLGYEWALKQILGSGVGINFRDVNGWTALHWAARFGREKMVAALLAAGASAEAVTDPTSQDPGGKRPADIAADNGHKGLAGYLSEVALTSHLSSLTLEESEISIGSAEVEAERTMESISQRSDQLQAGGTEDQSLKDSLAAVRNAAQAAARIQCAFRAHSFRKKQEKASVCRDDCGMTPIDIHRLSVASKAYRPYTGSRDQKFNKAALSIQKNYKGWKGRKDFLTLRRHVVRIQAHVRGHQCRKKYKEILWSVGFMDKAILRWRRRGVGLRGFRAEPQIDDGEEDEDIAKVFRKTKVDEALNKSVSRVLSMVRSPEARQQYHRVLEGYRKAKAELSNADEADLDLWLDDDCNMLMFT